MKLSSASHRIHIFVSGIVVLLVAVVAFILIGSRPLPGNDSSGTLLERAPFELSIAASGLIQPIEVVDVGAQVSGQLAKLHVKIGDRVRQGQLLAEIDDRLIKSRLVQAEASSGAVRAQIRAKKAQLTYAEAQQSRTEALVLRSISPRTQAELAQSTTETLTAEIEGLQAQLNAQTAAVDGIRLDLENTRIGAPVDGIVTAVVAQRGQTLNANQQAPVILRLSQDNPLMLVLRIPEADAERVRTGMRLRFTLLGGSSKIFKSTIGAILRSPTIINDVIYYDAIAYLEGGIDLFAFGRTVQAFVVVETVACALHLPRSLLPFNTASEDFVQISVRKPDGAVAAKKIRLEALNDVSGAITCEQAERVGINPSDRVVQATRIDLARDD